MQSTVIKIKFTPIVRHFQKDNTKCCLEIVPDISCVQNLDKIEWKENKFVEYSVPVTYKIIVRRDTDKNTVRKQEKVYYSCIDLRLLSTNSAMACGYLNKVISDNYVLSNVTDYKSRCTIVKSVSKLKNNTGTDFQPLNSHKEKNLTDIPEVLNGMCVKSLYIKKDDFNEIVRNDMNFDPSPQNIEVIEDKKNITHVCTECTVCKETITDPEVRNKEKERKLTIASVCTINTIDNPVCDESKNNNNKILVKHKPIKKIDFKLSRIMESLATADLCTHRSICTVNNELLIKKAPYERILPELRVAHFMMTVENEILPLKILLSEIYRKCTSLGLLWKSNVLRQSSPSPQPTCYTDTFKFLNVNKTKPKCNRVVYSIVFEE